jgi:DNA ligase-1
VLDGELYAPGHRFQTIVSLVKQRDVKNPTKKPTKPKKPERPTLEFHVFDVCMLSAVSTPFAERHAALARIVSGLGRGRPSKVVLVPCDACGDARCIERQMARRLAEGFEGLMIRSPAGPYESKRSRHLLKYKRFRDDEFRIVSYHEAGGKDAGTVVFVCATTRGQTFRVRPQGTLEQRRAMFRDADRLVGKALTVRYQELTDGGVPRFPVGVAVRDYE